MRTHAITTAGAAVLAIVTVLAPAPWGNGMLALAATTQEKKRPAPKPAPSAPESRVPRSAASRGELARLVVMIRATLGDAPVVGAGVIFSRAGDFLHIVTANHVVRAAGLGSDDVVATNVEVQFDWLRGEWHRATLLDLASEDLDVAVLRVRGAHRLAVPRLPWASLVQPASVHPGERVVPMGYPAGELWFVPRLPHFVSSIGPQTIRTEGDLVAGYSGGALVTYDWGIAGLLRSTGSMFNESSRMDLVVQQLETWGLPVEATFRARRKLSGETTNVDDAPAPSARGRVDAERAVGRSVAAIIAGDVRAFTGLAVTPFHFQAEVVMNTDDVWRRLLLRFIRDKKDTLAIRSIRATTVGEWRQTPDAARDRMMRERSMTDADWGVTVALTSVATGRADKATFIVRKIDGTMKVVGLWD
jgi:Trypsin-like peptidase domain